MLFQGFREFQSDVLGWGWRSSLVNHFIGGKEKMGEICVTSLIKTRLKTVHATDYVTQSLYKNTKIYKNRKMRTSRPTYNSIKQHLFSNDKFVCAVSECSFRDPTVV